MKSRMITGAVAAVVLVALTAAPSAFAHTHVQKMSIAENAKLEASPPDFTVQFEEKTTLASVALTNNAGKRIPLAYKPSPAKATSFRIPFPTLAAGSYMLTWRTIGADGHAMASKVHFTVAHS